MKEFAVQELTLGQVLDAAVEAFPLGEAVVPLAANGKYKLREMVESRFRAASESRQTVGARLPISMLMSGI